MLRANNIIVRYKTGLFRQPVKALDNFSIAVNRGDIFALLGPNGAGKSTAMYCFLGLIQPDEGSVAVLGGRPEPGSRVFNKMAYLPEEPHYHHYLTVEEAVRFYGDLYLDRVSPSRVTAVLEQVGLAAYRKRRLSRCSKGMKQKVGIAACVLSRPELILLDEPTRGLDPIMAKTFRDILLDMSKDGATIVVSSHILSEVELVCNHVAIVNEGKVVVQDTMSNLVQGDRQSYYVEFGRAESVPDYIADLQTSGNTMTGRIPLDQLEPFMRFVRDAGVSLKECSLKKVSLEKVFFDIVGGKNDPAT